MLLNECLLQYFSFLCVTMMVFSVCVNETVYLLYMLVFKSCLRWAFVRHVTHHHLLLVVINVLQRYKTDTSVLPKVDILALYQLMK